MNVTIIGAGNMGRGIATRLLSGGHSVTLIDQNEAQAAELAKQLQVSAKSGATVGTAPSGSTLKDEVVVLAVYYPVVAAVVEQYGKQFDGKVVVDITNTLNDTFTEPRFDNTSGAEEIAKLLPNSKVVKAFNTTFAGTLISGQVAGQPLDVLIAGDDSAAKALVADLAQAGGLRPVDVGPLRRARQLEAVGFLHITLQGTLGTNWGSAVKFIS
ncbi:MAG: NAD(P)-binding domain-containing protein [Chloroflexi bacterium]|nr:NAD(P)-binding domain-containing protein [Chloroflexota bacterium]